MHGFLCMYFFDFYLDFLYFYAFLFDYTFYYYRKDNVGAMTKNPSLRHFLSNVVVTKRWFEFINHSNMEENDKKVILTRFANSYIYNLKNIYCLSKDEYTIIAEKMLILIISV